MRRTAVLIVDDSSSREGLVSQLKRAGFVTALVSRLSEAEGYLRNLRFDMVLVDIDRDTREASRLLDEVAREQPSTVRITTTASGHRGIGLPHLRKPFALDVLLACADTALAS
jgi:DNA-binding NtrC family response regulator